MEEGASNERKAPKSELTGSMEANEIRKTHRASKQRRSMQSKAWRIEESSLPTVAYKSDLQRRLHEAMKSTFYELGLGAVVCFNVIMMVIDVDSSRTCTEEPCSDAWLDVIDHVLLGIYTLDVALAIFAQRSKFFQVGLNLLDFTVVSLGYLDILIELFVGNSTAGLGIMRLFRIARLIRIAKIVRPIPELHRLIVGFIFTLRAIFWGFVMIVLLCMIWAIIILQVFDMLEADTIFEDPRFGAYWCNDAMLNTKNTMLLLWQTMITGDSWGACTLPVILYEPMMYFVYAAAFICVNVGFQNLILAIIVEHASNRTEEDKIAAKLQEKEEQENDINEINEILKELDADGSGGLSRDEMLRGFEQRTDLRTSLMMKFGIDKCDLEQIIMCFDKDDVGEVSYGLITEGLLRSQRQEEATQLMVLQAQMSKMIAQMTRIGRRLDEGGVGTPSKESQMRNSDASKLATTDFPDAPSKDSEQGKVFEEVFADVRCTAPPPTEGYLEAARQSQLESLEKSLEASRRAQFESLDAQLQSISTANLDVRLTSISRMLQQKSESLAEETRMLTATLSQLAARVQLPSSFAESVSQPTAKPVPGRNGEGEMEEKAMIDLKRFGTAAGMTRVAKQRF